MTPLASALVAPVLYSEEEDPALAKVELAELRRELRVLLPPWREKMVRADLVHLEVLIECIDSLVGSSR